MLSSDIYYILDEDLNVINMVELYSSMIWTNRFWDVGDFELYLPATPSSVNLFTDAINNHWIIVGEKDLLHGMMPMKLEIEASRSDGNYISVKGYDLKYILNRRIIWEYRNAGGAIEDELIKLVEANAISPTNKDRIIPHMSISETRSGVTDIIDGGYFGQNLAVAIKDICKLYGCGWDVTIDLDNKKFIFQVLKSTDRRETVLFSNEMENLLSTTYTIDRTQPKNVAYVSARLSKYNEDKQVYEPYDCSQIVTLSTTESMPTGMGRYELYVDNNENFDNTQYNVSQYAMIIRESAKKDLRDARVRDDISGELIPNYTYEFGVDYNIGDIVKVLNEYDQTFSARITEVIISRAKNKNTVIPSFSVIDRMQEAEPIDPDDVLAFIDNNHNVQYAVTPEGELLRISKVYDSVLQVYKNDGTKDTLMFKISESTVPVDIKSKIDPEYDYKLEEKSKWE